MRECIAVWVVPRDLAETTKYDVHYNTSRKKGHCEVWQIYSYISLMRHVKITLYAKA